MVIESVGFNKESFRKIITKTYENFFPQDNNNKHWKLEELMSVVVD
jgi:hypothetical protein